MEGWPVVLHAWIGSGFCSRIWWLLVKNWRRCMCGVGGV
jgi:hypothetical protein